MRHPKPRPPEDAPDYEHVQVHHLQKAGSVLEFTITTKPDGSTASIRGLFNSPDELPYASIEQARQHWEHLVNLGWEPIAG